MRDQEEPTNAFFERSREELIDTVRSLEQERDYAEGDIVTWKPRLRNKRFPEYGQPAYVVEILSSPVFDAESDFTSPYYREPLDTRLALLDDEGDLSVFIFDGRRFHKM